MKPSRSCLSALLVLISCAAQALALDPARSIDQYVHSVWRVENGLPHNGITSITQTRDGFLWLATYDGLARFDGLQFKSYNLIELLNLENNSVLFVEPGNDGRLWAASSSGLAYWKDEKLTSVPTPWPAADYSISALWADRQGDLWVTTRRGGAWKYSPGAPKAWTRIQGMQNQEIRAIFMDSKQTVWFATSGGLAFLRSGSQSTESVPAFEGKYLLSLLEDSMGRLWVGTRDDGLHLTRDGSPVEKWLPGGKDENTIIVIREDANKSIWVGTLGGLIRLRNGSLEKYSIPEGLSHNNVRALHFDREGSLWVGTNGGGLNQLRDGKFVAYTERQGLSSNVIMAVYEDMEGVLWVGTNGKGLNRIKDGKITSIASRDGLPNDNVWSIYGDRNRNLWIGTYGGGLSRLNAGKWRHYTTREGLASDNINAVFVDSQDVLWVGTGKGMSRLQNDVLTTYRSEQGLSHENVRVFAEDHNHMLWIGTYGGGLMQFRDGKFNVWKKNQGLSNNFVLSLYVDAENNLWIGTMGGGLNLMRDGQITHFPEPPDLPLYNIYQIMEDAKGNLWLSNARGVFRVAKKALLDYKTRGAGEIRYDHYLRSDGLPGGGCQGGFQPAGWRSHDGVLWFPTIEGLAALDPAKERQNPLPPPLTIDRIIAQGNSVDLRSDTGILPSGKSGFEFHFSGLSFVAPEKMRFRHILEGFEADWIDAGSRRFATYTNIHHGKYRFRVVGCNGDGVWNTEGASYEFRILPRFYETGVFYFLCGLVLLGAAFGAYRWRVRILHARQRELSEQVEKAVAEINVLSGLLPICASCKKIRDDTGYWNTVESYISSRSQAQFTHSICPQCLATLYPDYFGKTGSSGKPKE